MPTDIKVCPCGDVNHYMSRDTRAHLKDRLKWYQKHGFTERARVVKRTLSHCPSDWRHIP